MRRPRRRRCNKLITYAPDTGTPNLALTTAGQMAASIVTIPHAGAGARASRRRCSSPSPSSSAGSTARACSTRTIARQGTDQIVVQLPGVSDPDRVKTLIGTTAHMTFQLVDTTAAAGPDRAAGR